MESFQIQVKPDDDNLYTLNCNFGNKRAATLGGEAHYIIRAALALALLAAPFRSLASLTFPARLAAMHITTVLTLAALDRLSSMS